MHLGRRRTWLAGLLALVVLACVTVLEARFAGLETDEVIISETPVTLYRLPGATPLPPVIVAHGFGGSRQMMDQISVSLARQGFLVASLDLPGHGRNSVTLSPDITSLDGTTAQLVAVVEEVAEAIAQRGDTRGPISYVGHSMATDIVIRAAQARTDVGGVVAISMYSPAVTATEPRALLVLSGQTEGHLRGAGMDAVRLIAPNASEGETVTSGDVMRRTAVAPFVGHVGVLYAPTSLHELTGWLRQATGTGNAAALDQTGWVAGVLLLGLLLLARPVARRLPQRENLTRPELSWAQFALCLILPLPGVLAIAALPSASMAGHAAFGTLAAICGAWGAVQLALLRRAGWSMAKPDMMGLAGYLALALIFAVALDRYGAAFLPSGPRAIVMAGLLLGTLPLMIADTLLVHNASMLRRIVARAAFIAALAGAMALSPAELGVTFTTLPVLVLFFLVYGTMGRWVAARRGVSGVALGKAVVLAWAIAASTPLFAVTGLS